MNILAVGAHFDDVELGCGATLKKLNDAGHNIYIFVGTTSGFRSALSYDTLREDDDAQAEGKITAEMIGAELICGEFPTFHLDYSNKLNTMLMHIIEKYWIDWIFTHWDHDPHHDHWSLVKSVFHAGRHVKRVLAYQSSWHEAESQFAPNFFVDISKYWDFKMELLKSFHSEYSRVGDKWQRFCESNARINGLKINCIYAEGFQCIRWSM